MLVNPRARLRLAVLGAIGLLLLCSAGILAAATTPVTYTGCLNKFTGIPYNVAVGTAPLHKCLGSDPVISWNNVGPQGPKGDTGATGAKGDTGATGAQGNPGLSPIKTLDNIDLRFVEYDKDGNQLNSLTVWMETDSASRACLATSTEWVAPTPMLNSLNCAWRQQLVNGVMKDGIWLHLGLAGPMLSGSFSVNVYQEGAKGYGDPVPWGPYQH